jgi:hypothetical protein
MCHFLSSLWSFLEESLEDGWHLGCVNKLAAGVGRPVRTAQTRQTGQRPTVNLFSSKEDFCLLI